MSVEAVCPWSDIGTGDGQTVKFEPGLFITVTFEPGRLDNGKNRARPFG
jgi:hypothetical protein